MTPWRQGQRQLSWIALLDLEEGTTKTLTGGLVEAAQAEAADDTRVIPIVVLYAANGVGAGIKPWDRRRFQ